MNCRKLQSYLEDCPLTSDQAGCAEVTEHIAGCANCRRLMETRAEMNGRLHLLRESAPPFPASLDAAILANYRRQTATLETSQSVLSRTQFRLGSWRLSAAVAAVLLIFAAVLVLRKSSVTTEGGGPQLANLTKTAPLPQKARPDPPVVKAAGKGTLVAHRDGSKLTASTKQGPGAVSPAKLEDSATDGFRSLMYCDELSCDGGMEVVRVQLPSRSAGFMPASADGDRVVTADVLVGADGFARGIRIVH